MINSMSGEKVSIIIPCYNLEKVIIRCIDSIVRQTYTNLEIIVVDDGSKDSSFLKIQDAAQKDNRIIAVSQENAGPSAARNHGIDLATGDYIMFVDGDDYVPDTYVEHFMEAADGCDMVIGGLRYVFPDGGHLVVEEAEFRCKKEEYVQKHYTQSVANRTIFGPYNKLYRTAIIKENGVRFDESLKIREDGIFVLEVLAHAQVICGIGYAQYNYIQSAPNESLVSKFHPTEKEINKKFFQMLVSVIGEENLTDTDIRLIYPMFLNMDISSIRKLYFSKEYTLARGLRYIRGILSDDTFRRARATLCRVDKKAAIKYYRPLIMVHMINYLAAKKRK